MHISLLPPLHFPPPLKTTPDVSSPLPPTMAFLTCQRYGQSPSHPDYGLGLYEMTHPASFIPCTYHFTSPVNVSRKCLSNPSFLVLPISTVLGEHLLSIARLQQYLPGDPPHHKLSCAPNLQRLSIKLGKPQDEDTSRVFLMGRRQGRCTYE